MMTTESLECQTQHDQLEQALAENRELRIRNGDLEWQIAMLRTGDTCARQCEGAAYRIRCTQLEAQIAEMEGRP